MKKKLLSYFLLLTLSISACGTTAAAPTLDDLSVQNTATTGTQTVLPTNTTLPSTEIFTETPLPTDTLVPSPTLDAPATPTVVLLPTELPTFTPQPADAGAGTCSQQLLSWKGSTSNFVMLNETTNPKAKIQLLVSVTTKLGECGWLNINGSSFFGPAGTYSVTAFVSGTPRISGAFFIQGGNWKIVVRDTGIVALGSCYPNC